jgi:MFS family permease
VASYLLNIGPLRQNRNFRLIALGQLISVLGSSVTLVAIPFQVYRDTHNSLMVGLTSLLQLPFLIAGSLVGGALGDRLEKRRLLLLGAAASAAVDLALALNAVGHNRHVLIVMILAALLTGVMGFSGPLRTAAIPVYLGPDDLVAGYSIMQVIFNTGAVLGPSLAGLILSFYSLSACYALDALTFAALVVTTYFVDPLPPSGSAPVAPFLRAIREGFRYVRSHPIVQAVYLADLNAMFFGLPRALFPAMALTVYHGGPRTLGLLYAAPSVGAVIMALLTGWVERVRRRGRLIVGAIVLWGLAMALFGLVHFLWCGVVALAVAGATDVISTVLRNTMLQLAISDEYRSRLSAIQIAVVTGGPRLGDAESGVVASFSSTEFSIVSGGIACIVGVVVLAWRRPVFWRSESD